MEDNAKTVINVAGDYVQSKHVDYEINNVEAGGIGIQIVNNAKTTMQPKEGKTVVSKKSPHFLETPPLVYKYKGEQFDGTRRLTLLYQFLCKEYDDAKTWIDPQTTPKAFLGLFGDEPTNDVITWTVEKQKLFGLFKRMKERGIITVPKGYGIWQIVENHFSDWRGNRFQDLHKEHKPKGPVSSVIEKFIDLLDPAQMTNADLDECAKQTGTSFGNR